MIHLKARSFSRETDLSGAAKTTVIASLSECGQKAAKEVLRMVSLCNPRAELLINPQPDALYSNAGPIILIGNLADSLCVEELYYRFLCVTDRWYPGPGGYELRTLVNPFNTGYNIILLGYSDEPGLNSGVCALKEKIRAGGIPFLWEVNAAHLHFPESKANQLRADKIDLKDPTIYLTAGIDEKAYVAYMAGNKALLKEYADCWESLLQMECVHLMLYKKAVVWRLLEINGLIPDSLREKLANFFFDWANGEEGIGSLQEAIYQTPDFPRQNHGLIPALGLLYLYDYFKRFYPELTEPEEWRKQAEIVFEPYCKGSWKPLCDGLCHGWWLSQPALFDFGIFDEKHRFFESGGAKKAADCALAVINNEGYMPNAGDSDILRQFPGYCLNAAAAYFQNPEYQYAKEMAPFSRRGYCGPITFPPRSFDIGLPKTVPESKTGISVIPVDPIVYHAWEKAPLIAEHAVDTPPAAQIECCFDKLAMRSGWGPKDDYLLMDGLGGGSHSYPDAMSILDYQIFGVSFFAAEDSLHWPEPENHSLVTIYRDGKTDKIPGFAQILKTETALDGTMYAAMKLSGVNGADWIREIRLVPGTGVVFQDTITALCDGDYAIETHFRIPGTAELADETVSCRRKSADGAPIYFHLLSRCSDDCIRFVTKIPLGINYRTQPGKTPPVSPETNPAAAIRRRYHLEEDAEICLTAFTSRIARRLKRGESVCFTHAACASKVQTRPAISENKLIVSGHLPVPLLFFYSSVPGVYAEKKKEALPEISLSCRLSASSVITAADLTPNGRLLYGTIDGTVAMTERSGETVWERRLEEPIHSLSSVKTNQGLLIFAGYGKNGICSLHENGDSVWSVRLQRIPTLYPWWEMDSPAAVRVVSGLCGAKPFVLAGCGDNHVRKLSDTGEQLFAAYYFASVPGIIQLMDVNNDGILEAVVAGGHRSADSGVEILDYDGVCRARIASEGWVSRTTALATSKEGDAVLTACGVNHRNNLQLYRIRAAAKGEESKEYSCERLFVRQLAGAVTGLVLLPEQKLLIACTSQGYIGAFDFEGNEVWMRSLPGSLAKLAFFQGKILAADNIGKLFFLSSEGVLVARSHTNAGVSQILCSNENLCLLCGKQVYCLPGFSS